MSTEIPMIAWISLSILLLGVIFAYSEVKNKIRKILAIPKFFLLNWMNLAALVGFVGLVRIDAYIPEINLPRFLTGTISLLIVFLMFGLMYFIHNRYERACEEIDKLFP